MLQHQQTLKFLNINININSMFTCQAASHTDTQEVREACEVNRITKEAFVDSADKVGIDDDVVVSLSPLHSRPSLTQLTS